MSEVIKNFTDLQVWQEAHKFVLGIYEITKKFPDEEKFGLITQLRRAAISITANIAEGFSRFYFKDKVRFYYIARGSVSETLNLLIISKDLGLLEKRLFEEMTQHNAEVISLINGLINSILKQVSKS